MKRKMAGIISILIIFTGLHGRMNAEDLVDTMAYDKHILSDNVMFDSPDDYLGKWILLKNNSGLDNNVFFIIYNEGGKYKFIKKYYNDIKNGEILWTEYNSIKMSWNDKYSDMPAIPWQTVGKPQWDGNTYVILIDSEGPLGFFQRLIE